MARVKFSFDGVSRGAVAAAKEMRLELKSVAVQATQTQRELKGTSEQTQRAGREMHGFAGHARTAERDLGRASRGALAGSGMFRSLGRSVAFASSAFLGGAGFIAVAKTALSEAQGLGGQMQRSNTVFRGNAREVQAWARTTSLGLGMARREALESANNFGTFLHAAGLVPRQTAAMSKTLTQLGADLAALHQADPADVLQTLETGIRGRTRALKEYGIIIDDDRIKAEAMRMGLVKTTTDTRKVGDAQTAVAIATAKLAEARRKYGEHTTQVASAELTLHSAEGRLHTALQGTVATLTPAQRAMATYRLILQQTADTHGYFAKHTRDAYEQQRILHAQLKDQEATLGRLLLPSIVGVVREMNKWLSSSKNQAAMQHTVKDAVAAVTGAVKTAIGVIRTVDKVTGSFKNTLMLLIGLKVASTLAGWVGPLGKLAKSLGNADAAAGEAGLLGSLKSLAKLSAAGLVVGVTVEIYEKLIPDFKGKHYSGIDLGRDIADKLFGIGHGPGGGKKPFKPVARGAGAGAAGAAAGGAALGGATDIQRGLVTTAAKALGNPYRFGGAPSISSPTDCSGLMVAVFSKHGISLPRTSQQQYAQAPIKNARPLLAGDLVFAQGVHPDHVGLYIGGGMVLEDPHTGDHVKTIPLRSFGWNGESARWWGGRPSAAKSGGATSTGSSASTGDTTGGTGGGLTVGHAAPVGPKGLTGAGVIGIRSSIDASLRTFHNLTPDVRKALSPLGVEAEKHLEDLRKHLRKGLSATDVAQTRASIRRWAKVLRDEISKAAATVKSDAEEKQRLLQRSVDRAIQARFREFDKETEAHNKAFEKETQAHITEMRKAFDLQMRDFDRETERGVAGLAAPDETPAEAALRTFREGRDAEARAKELADAQASGDQERIRQLALDDQERALQSAAEQERKSYNDRAEEAQRAYQQQRDDQRNALQEQEQIREDSYTEARQNELDAWNERRDDQLQAMKDDLDDWTAWIEAKRKTWKQFLTWLKDHGFAVPDSWMTDNAGESLDAAFRARATALQITLRSAGTPMASGGTIRAPWSMGADRVPLLAQHGETVIDRDLTEALRVMVATGSPGSDMHFHFDGAQFIGTPNRQAADAWARDMEASLDRLISYKKRLG